MKLFFLDVETTGTDWKKNGVIQISGIIEVDGEVKETVDYLVKPFFNDVIDKEALVINKRTEEELEGFTSPHSVYQEFTALLQKYVDKFDRKDKFQLIGYNARFDDDFLRAWFKKCGDNFYGSFFSWPALDITNLIIFLFLEQRNKFDNFKLLTVAKYLKIEVDESKTHDSMYDVELTKRIYETVKQKERSVTNAP